MSIAYRINTKHVASELIEGEIIIIHLDTGIYYTLAGAGADLWQLLEQPRSASQLLDVVTTRFNVDSHDAASTQLNAFLTNLVDERLVLANEEPEAPLPETPVPDEKSDFVAPVLEKYVDMQELLVLDPIHEVDIEGWPHAAPDAD